MPVKSPNQCFRLKRYHPACGQSVIELIVAVAIFAIIASTSVVAILGSFSATRLAQEETQAVLLATEGLEAVESIRNQNWQNLVDGSYGLVKGSGWSFNGTSDTVSKFSRSITIAEVRRDANGDISSSGTADEETKHVSARVAWNFSPTRQNTVEVSSYLTNWQEGVDTGAVSSSPTPTPLPVTCTQACTGNGYSGGTCRQNVPACNNNGETRLSAGDALCTGGAAADTCCCAP